MQKRGAYNTRSTLLDLAPVTWLKVRQQVSLQASSASNYRPDHLQTQALPVGGKEQAAKKPAKLGTRLSELPELVLSRTGFRTYIHKAGDQWWHASQLCLAQTQGLFNVKTRTATLLNRSCSTGCRHLASSPSPCANASSSTCLQVERLQVGRSELSIIHCPQA